MNPAHEQNRASWNAVTPAHNRHKGHQAAFLRAGGSTLFPEEQGLLEPVQGLHGVHLQCNCGQDTLSIAALGAEMVGVDIADEAVAFARDLSAQSGIPARFERSDVFDWLEHTEARFDFAFASYGATGWLSDIGRYARGLRRILKPGGRFVYVEFHPAVFVFDDQWRPAYPYSTAGADPIIEAEGVTDYVGRSEGALGGDGRPAEPFTNPHPSVSFAWGIGDILGAMLGAGLRIEHFAEYPYANGWKGFPGMVPLPGRRWGPGPGQPQLPFMYSLVATSPP